MAVYTHLDDAALKNLWTAYRDDEALVRAEGIAAGSINTTYRLQTDRAVYYLRVNEAKTTDEVVYERDVLDLLADARLSGVITPQLLTTRSGNSFVLLEHRAERPVWAAVFPALPGDELKVGDVNASHVSQVGAFLARAHQRLRAHRGGRANPFGISVVERWLAELAHAPGLTDDVTRSVLHLRRVLADVRAVRRLLPRGVIHGDLFVDNTKWRGAELLAVFDWEMAGRDHLALDVAICLHAWCWQRDGLRAGQGTFDEARCRALLSGYQSVRPLSPSERRGLYSEALLGAVRFTVSRIRDFEVTRGGRGEVKRTHLDYRDFEARLRALEELGERGFQALVGLAADGRLRGAA